LRVACRENKKGRNEQMKEAEKIVAVIEALGNDIMEKKDTIFFQNIEIERLRDEVKRLTAVIENQKGNDGNE
jgi:hypothetical protein